ncbi:MAG: 30S ribosomal protein S12 methylthiotransferase RimO [Dehalococcoidales bacterium]|nr:30S ribosomal protein S12 methylthiotransferase RimO [Dehalococcoidales bacterium]
MSKTFHIVSLGCAKNTVDSDSMAQLLTAAGYKQTGNPERAQVLIVNTCGFIGTAKDESYNVLKELAGTKKTGQILIAAGCLTQRYGAEVNGQVSGIDGIMGTRRWMDIVQLVENLRTKTHPESRYHLPETDAVGKDEKGALRVAVQGASAYIKIADGCGRPCAFCAIPLIKGTTISRRMELILSEAVYLQERGIREIILIAQHTTDYGYDLGMKNGLALLLSKLTEAAPNVDWIRIMYAYPGYVTDELIEVMAKHKQILHYLDIPLQHAHPAVLKRMLRPTNIEWVYKTLEKMRQAMPDLALRTTFIVGYPGETEKEFQTLIDFIGEIRFDKVGAFKFSLEPGTACEPLGDTVPDEVKEERLQRLMTRQQQISLERNREFIGRKLDVLIEGAGQGVSIGRSYRDAPEIDGLVIVKGETATGQIIPVNIKEAMPYDLSGTATRRKKSSLEK